MKRLALLAVAVVGACSAPDGPVPHIVAAELTTTTQTPSSTTAPPRPVTTRAARAKPRYSAPVLAVMGPGVWTQLARCESGGNPRAVGGGGRYFGAYQFSLTTWHSIGETGNPIDYSYEHQLAAAKRLQERSGFGQWPKCARRLGLR